MNDLVIDSVQFVFPLILVHSVFAPASDPDDLFPGGGGVLELFFDGVCGPRSETPTHI